MTTKEPFFSVLLPTRNRPALAARAIRSVLDQSFTDWELIVAENSDEERWIEGRELFVDRRVSYLGTFGRDRLTMWDNWQRALEAARGRYVLVLTDKCLLAPRALELLHNEYPRFGLATWRIRRPARADVRLKVARRLVSKDYGARDVWRQFWRFGDKTDVFPHGANMCWARGLWTFGAPLFTAANPDYLGGARLLVHAKVVRHVDFPVTVIPRDVGVEASVGAAWQMGVETAAVREYRKDAGLTKRDSPCFGEVVVDFMDHGFVKPGDFVLSPQHYWRWVFERLAARRSLSAAQRLWLREVGWRHLGAAFRAAWDMVRGWLARD